MRVARVLAIVLLVVPLLTVLGLALALDPLVRSNVPARMSEALGVPVTLNDADAGLGGDIRLERLAIANPKGYEDAQALRVHSLSADVKATSLLSDVVEVRTLTVERPHLSIEFEGLQSNVRSLIDNLPPSENEKGKRFRIDRLTIEGATVRLTSDQIPGGTRTLTLPTIALSNVGTSEGAATMGQLASEVLRALLREALKHGAELPSQLAESLGQAVQKGAGRALDRAKEKLEDVPGLLEEQLRRGVDDLQKKKAE